MQDELEAKLKQIKLILTTIENGPPNDVTQILEEMADWIKGLIINYCE